MKTYFSNQKKSFLTTNAKLAKHIEKCENCRQERELFLESWTALDEFEPELEPCPLIRAKVWEMIREEEQLPPPLIEEETAESFNRVLQTLSLAGLALMVRLSSA